MHGVLECMAHNFCGWYPVEDSIDTPQLIRYIVPQAYLG